MINIKTALFLSLLLAVCLLQVSAANNAPGGANTAVTLPAGNDFASDDDIAKADANQKGSGSRVEQSLAIILMASLGMVFRNVAYDYRMLFCLGNYFLFGDVIEPINN